MPGIECLTSWMTNSYEYSLEYTALIGAGLVYRRAPGSHHSLACIGYIATAMVPAITPTSLDATRSAGLFKGHLVRSQGSIVVLPAAIPWRLSSLGLGMFGATKLKGALGHTNS